ncbi:hypothetical protein FHP25_28875 [Vineibacter terrae]|uniref:DUF4846 domain-containing protein n=1 Tax=Vineibacter terrae TaxID=2586908 RepID=A0A5C8PDV2_9HYPH|nr:DUF4846 domain-containing protein [Vineibacter terrae]TXL71707.1 hypothetical protein FHP25_28875 [Vineibacter terrae]
MISRRFLLAGTIATLPMAAWSHTTAAQSAEWPAPEWLAGPALDTLVDRFPAPAGFQRLSTTSNTFGEWLRQLPLRPAGEPVRLYDGRLKPDQSGVAAVIDIDVGRTNLQQCADAIIRLRAEYLRATKRLSEIAFHFTSGDLYAYADWLAGRRPLVQGNMVSWTSVGPKTDTRRGFRSWLDIIFTYAGSVSLQRELVQLRDPSAFEPGDVLIQPGMPGHAVLIVDVVVNPGTGERRALLLQSFMPAQNIHVLNNPGGGAWYRITGEKEIVTPEWTFAPADLRRFPER